MNQLTAQFVLVGHGFRRQYLENLSLSKSFMRWHFVFMQLYSSPCIIIQDVLRVSSVSKAKCLRNVVLCRDVGGEGKNPKISSHAYTIPNRSRVDFWEVVE